MELRRAYQYARFLVNNFLRRSPGLREQWKHALLPASSQGLFLLPHHSRIATLLRVNYLSQTRINERQLSINKIGCQELFLVLITG
jgi:hypothetical protein